jgi:hypothetical protein
MPDKFIAAAAAERDKYTVVKVVLKEPNYVF